MLDEPAPLLILETLIHLPHRPADWAVDRIEVEAVEFRTNQTAGASYMRVQESSSVRHGNDWCCLPDCGEVTLSALESRTKAAHSHDSSNQTPKTLNSAGFHLAAPSKVNELHPNLTPSSTTTLGAKKSVLTKISCKSTYWITGWQCFQELVSRDCWPFPRCVPACMPSVPEKRHNFFLHMMRDSRDRGGGP